MHPRESRKEITSRFLIRSHSIIASMSSAGESLLALLRPQAKGSGGSASAPVAAESQRNRERMFLPVASREGSQVVVPREEGRRNGAVPVADPTSLRVLEGADSSVVPGTRSDGRVQNPEGTIGTGFRFASSPEPRTFSSIYRTSAHTHYAARTGQESSAYVYESSSVCTADVRVGPAAEAAATSTCGPSRFSAPAGDSSRGSVFQTGVARANFSSEAARQHSSGFSVPSAKPSAASGVSTPAFHGNLGPFQRDPAILSASRSSSCTSSAPSAPQTTLAQQTSVTVSQSVFSSLQHTSSSPCLQASEFTAATAKSLHSAPFQSNEGPACLTEVAQSGGLRSDAFKGSVPLDQRPGSEGSTEKRNSRNLPAEASSVSNTTRVLLAALGAAQPTLLSRSKREDVGSSGVSVEQSEHVPVAGARSGTLGNANLPPGEVPTSIVMREQSFSVSTQRTNAGSPDSESTVLAETRTVEIHQRRPSERAEASMHDAAGVANAVGCLDSSVAGTQPKVASPPRDSPGRDAPTSFAGHVSCITSSFDPLAFASPGDKTATGILGVSLVPSAEKNRETLPAEGEPSAGRREDGPGSEKNDDKKEKGQKKKRKKEKENEKKEERSTLNSCDAQSSSSCSEATSNQAPGEDGADAPTNLTAEREKANGIKRKCRDPALLDEALLDCYGRFITLLPDAFLRDRIHLYFQIQEAFWWYDDIWWEKHAERLPKLTLKDFGCLICHDCPILQHYIPPEKHDKFLANWKRYCRTIPLRGAIILNEDLSKCLMVTGWKGGTWMFPRGKVDEMEQDAVCACREIWEEVGVDISPYIDEEVYVEHVIEEQPIKLFIIPGIKETVNFQPLKRKEIGRIGWIDTWRLPGWHLLQSPHSAHPGMIDQQKFLRTWQVEPFIPALRGWIELLKKSGRRFAAVAAASTKRAGGSPVSSVSLHALPSTSTSTCIAGCYYQVAPDVSRHVIEHLQDAARALPYSAALAGIRLKPSAAPRQSPSPQKGPVSSPAGALPEAFQAATSQGTRPQKQIGTLPWTGSVTTGAPESYNAETPVLNTNTGKPRVLQARPGAGGEVAGVRTPQPAGEAGAGGAVCTPEGVEPQEESAGVADDGHFGHRCTVSGGAGFSGYHLPAAGRGRGHLVGMRLREVGLRSFDDQDVDRRRALQQLTFGGQGSALMTKVPLSPSSGERLAKTPRGSCSSASESPGEGGASAAVGQRGHGAAGRKKKSSGGDTGDTREASGGQSPPSPVAAPQRKKATSLDDLGVSYHVPSKVGRRGERAGPGAKKARAWGKDRCNNTTFGGGHGGGWSVEEMFRFNEENFGVVSTYDIESYTVPLPKKVPPQGGEGIPRRGSARSGGDASSTVLPTPASAIPKTQQTLRQIGIAAADPERGREGNGASSGNGSTGKAAMAAAGGSEGAVGSCSIDGSVCRAREDEKGEKRRLGASASSTPLSSKAGGSQSEHPTGNAVPGGNLEKSGPWTESRVVTPGLPTLKEGSIGSVGRAPEAPTRLCQNAQASAALLGLLKGGVNPPASSLEGRGKETNVGTTAEQRAKAGGDAKVGGDGKRSVAEAPEATVVAPTTAARESGVAIKGPFVFDAFLQKVKEQQRGLVLSQESSLLAKATETDGKASKAEGARVSTPTLATSEGTTKVCLSMAMRQLADSPGMQMACSSGPFHRFEMLGPGRDTAAAGVGDGTVSSPPKTPSCVSPPRYVAEKQRRQQEAWAESGLGSSESDGEYRAMASPPPAPYMHSMDSPGYVSEGPNLGRLANALGSETSLPSFELHEFEEREVDAHEGLREDFASVTRGGDNRWAIRTAGSAEAAGAGRGHAGSPALTAQRPPLGTATASAEGEPAAGGAQDSSGAGEESCNKKDTRWSKKTEKPGVGDRVARQQLSEFGEDKGTQRQRKPKTAAKDVERASHLMSGAEAAQVQRGREAHRPGPDGPEMGFRKNGRRQRRGAQRRNACSGSRGESGVRSGEEKNEDGTDASDDAEDEYEQDHTILGKLRRLSQDMIPVSPPHTGAGRQGRNSRPVMKTHNDEDAATGVNESAMVEVFSMWLSQGPGAPK
ncbi:hydrolase, NUDIX family protein [Toxoplasma gondii ME49]|uniref:Hydrolase, NUDIX family protein n=1 Tax=Toxoplasma gondii (strain ATCC 50611 / Me49) TaxID=508771 RepID=S8GFM7_TOXGM|nr:hydrolase, NUDIX family protein [Toxoplasma gondii ME49]EPT27234.1 hydrolase, NUDIX family protein [Toxoplasma gondii ME49]|eukprot:XP_002366388.2 hydrolase, NUDIX family protein [Toxoplasma gondii ME49]